MMDNNNEVVDDPEFDLGLGNLSQLSSQNSFNDVWKNIVQEEEGLYTQLRNPQNILSFSEMSQDDLLEIEGEQMTYEGNDEMWQSIVDNFADGTAMADIGQMASNPNQFNPSSGNCSQSFEPANVLPDSSRNSVIPSNTNYPGPYEFEITFPDQPEKVTKSTSWTYSEQLDKLYVDMGVYCIFSIKTKKLPPAGSIIRALPVYEKSEHVSQVVKRCPTHTLATDQLNSGHPAPEHFIRCQNDQARYYDDPASCRQSVEVPFVGPQGNDTSQYLYGFMCLGSCPGGPNRRPIKIIFTLETGSVVLGRRALSLRVCACPGRDRKTDENNLLCPKEGKRKSAHPTLVQTTSADLCVAEIQSKKRKMDDDTYMVPIRGRANYELLMKMKQCLELASMVPDNVLHDYQNEQRQQHQAARSAVPLLRGRDPTSDLPSTSKSVETVAITNGAVSTTDSDRDEQEANARKPRLKKVSPTCSKANARRTEESPPAVNARTDGRALIKKETDTESIESWLSSIGMTDYLDLFAKRGLLQMSQLETFSEEELRDLCIGESHRAVLWKALQVYRSLSSDLPSSQQSGWSAFSQSGSFTSGQPSIIRLQRIRFKRVSSLKKNDPDHSS